MSAESKVAAPVGGVLAEVMGLLRKADFREVRWGWRDDKDAPGSLFHEPRRGHAYAIAMCPRYGKDDWEKNAKAIVAAVNFLRSHGEAIRELAEAAHRVLDYGLDTDTAMTGGEWTSAMDSRSNLRAALARFQSEAES